MNDNQIRTWVRVHLLLAALVALGWAAIAELPQTAKRDVGVVIQEDDPRWDCKTMGNKICGIPPVDTDGSDGCTTTYNGQGGVSVCLGPRKEAPKLEA